MNGQRSQVRLLITGLLEKKGDRRVFADQDSLIAGGRLDSVEVLEIVMFLEQTYALDFADGFDARELDSVDAILKRIGHHN